MALKDVDTAHVIDIASVAVEPEAIRRLPRALALSYDILPVSSDGNQITIALADANDEERIDRARLATGMRVRAVSASRDVIRRRLSDAYGEAPIVLHAAAAPAGEAPAISAVDEIHLQATVAKASDIHIEPDADGGRVRQRVDGTLRECRRISAALYSHVVSRIKFLAGMDIADRRQPQDGRYVIEAVGRSLDARVSSMPTIAGEKLVIRLLDHHASIPRLEQLEIPPEALKRFGRVCRAPYGFIIAAGPTGSGKTTTLYGVMAHRDVTSENLCSVEDPIEVRMPGIAQVQVNARAGVTFASALRAFLRQDPNVIMVGEMRDQETAAVAALASLSGQLVLTTLHSNDAPSAIDRLIELGTHRYTVAAGLSAVVAQRLIRKLCAECREPAVAGRVAAEFGIADDTPVFRASRCRHCNQSGYCGRSAIFEVLFVDDAIREAIASGTTSVGLRAIARRQGFHPMLEHGLARVLAGQTTFEELRRVLVIETAA